MEYKHSANFIDKTNMRFGKLVAVEYLGNKMWKCHCDCGNECIVNSDRLVINEHKTRRGTHSCGCGKKSRLTQNYDFFKIIDSEEKAYILGFLAADGTITNNSKTGSYSIKLVLQLRDKNILEKIKEAIGTKAEIKEFESTGSLPQGTTCTSNLCSLLINNKDLTEQLVSLGVTPAKSYTLQIDYSKIPDKFKKDFWRGLVDGDGSFGIYGKKHILSMCITTSENMCISTKHEILNLFPHFHINYYHAIGCSEFTMRFIITTQQDVFDFLDYLYKDSTIYLDRKYQDYLKIAEQFKTN